MEVTNTAGLKASVERALAGIQVAAEVLLADIEQRLPEEDHLSPLAVIEAEYWKEGSGMGAATFHADVEKIRLHHGQQRTATGGRRAGQRVAPRINMTNLEEQAARYKLRMMRSTDELYARIAVEKAAKLKAANEKAAAAEKRAIKKAARGDVAAADKARAKVRRIISSLSLLEAEDVVGLSARLWRSMAEYMAKNCPEWFKLAKMALVMVAGSAEDERNFSGLKFVQSDLRCRLSNPHLTDALRLYLSSAYNVHTFPYDQALEIWLAAKGRYGS